MSQAKVNIEAYGYDLFTQRNLFLDGFPVSLNVDVPVLGEKECWVLMVSDDWFLSLWGKGKGEGGREDVRLWGWGWGWEEGENVGGEGGGEVDAVVVVVGGMRMRMRMRWEVEVVMKEGVRG